MECGREIADPKTPLTGDERVSQTDNPTGFMGPQDDRVAPGQTMSPHLLKQEAYANAKPVLADRMAKAGKAPQP